MTLIWIIIGCLISGILSLIGGAFLFVKPDLIRKFSTHLVSFAVGALLATAFLDLLPEALELGEGQGIAAANLLIAVMVGIVGFFILESLILKFHPHHHDDEDEFHHHTTPKLLLFGDTMHNFIDGVVIAGAFLTSIPLGIVTALAVAAHELPQEIGDFSVMLHHGWSKAKVLIANIVSSLSNIAGAFLAFFASNYLEPRLPYLLALTSGIFIYIAAADLIPEISMYHRRDKTSHVFVLIVLGIFAVGVLRYYLEGSH